ncbi:hypothetical protein ATE92_1834 [Ulvibacter sp. MAR_2010_11]|uniref:hypothetical protein n=1 Tax=Ulvibacter sp. MAR_2010_11 TaxID=1250229 RepID=UPI000CCB273E|nr:hypothetical protein [Ulvibacter sp. MAR_2010_11]PKA83669.1 hypothetical protein ATE92_1834 [Ulvibacter sp. MAR_2010_11]
MKVSKSVSSRGMSKLFFTSVLMTFLVCMFSLQSFAQNCNSKMVVSHDRDLQSAIVSQPAKFQMELTNNSATTQTYTMEYVNSAKTFTYEGKAPSRLSANNNLNTTISYNGSVVNSISVPPHSTVSFHAIVSIPEGTPINKWGVIELKAKNSKCSEGTLSSLLKVLSRDPSEN